MERTLSNRTLSNRNLNKSKQDLSAKEIRLHSSCRSVDPKNLKSYPVSRDKAQAAEKKK